MLSKQEVSISSKPDTPFSKGENRHRRIWKYIVFGGLLPLAVILAGSFISVWLMKTAPQAKTQPQKRNATLVEVRTVDYTSQQTVISGMGTVTAASNVEIIPQVSGRIIKLSPNLVPGGYLQKGETLLKIDPTDYRLTVRERAADVAKAESDLHLEQGNQLIAQKEYSLLGEMVTDQEKALMLRRPQLGNLQAALEAARAKLDKAKVDLARTELTAPFNAVVLSRKVNLGTQASQSSALATLVGTDIFWVEVSVQVSQLSWIKIPRTSGDKGALVRIYDTAAWGGGVHRQGRVIRLKSDLESEGRMARLLIQVEDPLSLTQDNRSKPRMLMGSYVRVEIEGNALDSAMAVEREFIRNGSSVWVMTPEGKLAVRPVDIAFRGADRLLITGGIESGEQLIITDLAAPVEGMAIKTLDNNPGQTTTGQAGGQGDQS
ncbi:MAG: efflux RND transporter periplasmic adaptor subunit [Desulfobacterium sp.]|jgi:RND family efflux transporter MFP subunit|nr:efflux RND transporter periplasmic adaptor subunit [Desulfobacterium sp.]